MICGTFANIIINEHPVAVKNSTRPSDVIPLVPAARNLGYRDNDVTRIVFGPPFQ